MKIKNTKENAFWLYFFLFPFYEIINLSEMTVSEASAKFISLFGGGCKKREAKRENISFLGPEGSVR